MSCNDEIAVRHGSASAAVQAGHWMSMNWTEFV